MSWHWRSDPGPRSRLQYALGCRNATAPFKAVPPSAAGAPQEGQPLRVRVAQWLLRHHASVEGQVSPNGGSEHASSWTSDTFLEPKPEHTALMSFLVRAMRRMETFPSSLGPFIALSQSTPGLRAKLAVDIRAALASSSEIALLRVLSEAAMDDFVRRDESPVPNALHDAVTVADNAIDDVPDDRVFLVSDNIRASVKALEAFRDERLGEVDKKQVTTSNDTPDGEVRQLGPFVGVIRSDGEELPFFAPPDVFDDTIRRLKRLAELTGRPTYWQVHQPSTRPSAWNW